MSESYVNSFRLGCDPEFVLLDSTNRIHRFTSNSRQVGQDHGGLVVELRPLPSYSVKGLLENVKTLLDSPILRDVADKRWRGGAYYNDVNGNTVMLGGHIHIETPYQFGTSGSSTIPAVAPDVFAARMDAMDHVTKMFEEIDLLPKVECASRRTGGYGRFGHTGSYNYHQVTDEYTRQQRVEYRSPCSWLFNPKNAFMLVTALKLATVSPVSVMKVLPGGSPDKIWEGIVKLYRNFQHIDHDAYLAANKICRSSNPDNIERLKADTNVDMKASWKLKNYKPVEATA